MWSLSSVAIFAHHIALEHLFLLLIMYGEMTFWLRDYGCKVAVMLELGMFVSETMIPMLVNMHCPFKIANRYRH